MKRSHRFPTKKIGHGQTDAGGHFYRRAFVLGMAFWLFSNPPTTLAQVSTSLVLDPHKAITQYSHEVWNDEALPQSAVQAIVQTPDGYLWMGFEEGLARFDGLRFTLFHKGNTAAFAYDDVVVLYVDRAGNLWIGTDGGGLLRYQAGEFTAFTTKDGLAGDVIESIYEDRQGALWIGTNRGLNRWQNGQFTTFTTQNGLSENVVLALCEDPASPGHLWIGTDGGGLNYYKNGKFATYKIGEGLANAVVWALHVDKSGGLWIGTNGGGLHCLNQGKMTSYTTKDGLASDFVRVIFEDSAGSLWIGTRGGLNRWYAGKFSTFSTQQGLSHDFVKTICADHEGSLWIGTYGGGLNRLRDVKFTNYSRRDGLSNNMVWTVYEDKAANLWFGTERGLNRFKDGKFTLVDDPPSGGLNAVTALQEDSAGNLWIGTVGQGLYRWRQGNWTRFHTQNGLSNNTVRVVLEDRQGRLWIGTDHGLNLLQNGKLRIYKIQDGLSSNEIRSLREDKAGALWIGTRAGGLNRFKDGQFTIFTTKDGLPSDLIRPIYEDEEGTLWIGTNGGGLSRFKNGKFTRYTSKDGLFNDSIFQILEDHHGNLWMSCNKGLFRISRKELNDFAEEKIKSITAVAYDRDDGMKTNECNGGSQPAGWKTHDGKLWFPTIAGVTMIDPNNLKTNLLPPPVVIEQVLSDRKPVPLTADLRLEPGSKNLEFHYTGLSLLAPQKVRFQYKLDGYDDDWIDAETRREAFYTNIPPGHYTFRVKACNNDGVWNVAGAELAFALQPYFYQTTWFYVLGALTLVLAGAAGYRYQVRRIRQREEETALRRAKAELEKSVQERTAALQESQNFLNSIIDNLPAMLFIKDAEDLRFVRFNRGGEDMIGLTEQEMLGKNDHDFFPKEQADFFTSKDRAVLNSGNTIDIAEEPIATKRGRRWLYTRKLPIFGPDGHPKYLLGLSEDITERKAAEVALRKSEEQFRLLFDLASIGMVLTSLDGRILRVNQAFCKLLDYTAAELSAMTLAGVTYPEDLAANLDLREQLLRGEISSFQMEKRLIAKDGHLLHVILQSSLAHDDQGQPQHFIGQIVDITGRKQAEEALQESETRFRQMAENIKSVFWLIDPAKNEMIYVSPAYEEIWGRDRASLYQSAQSWLAAVHPEDLQRVYEAVLLRHASGSYDEIYRILRPDGALRWIRDRGFPVRDDNGTIYRLAGISEDITALKQAEHEIRRLKEGLEKRVLERTAELRAANNSLEREIVERRRAQEQLQESENQVRQLAENINEVLWMESRDNNQLLYVSPVYEKIWGRTCASLYEQPNTFLESVHPDDLEVFKAHLGKQRQGETSEVEYRIIRPDQSIRWIRDRSFPIRASNAAVYRSAGVAEDITERRQAEEQIRRHAEELEEMVTERTNRILKLEQQRLESEKLATAGRMAARIAHEINNPLAGIQSSFQLIKDALPVTHRYYEYAGIIEREIERIANIIRQMYDLYRPEKESVRQFHLEQTIHEMVTLLQANSRERGVHIESDIKHAGGTVTLAEGLLRQVLYNLLQNAIEASAAGSVIKIAAAAKAKRLVITVTDQGHGIPEELRAKIFEPFFTTKNSGRQSGGLGLGLSVTKSIVEAMGGTIAFASQAGQGTVFTVEFPL